MDPNKTLDQLRLALRHYRMAQELENSADVQAHAEDVVHMVEALDDWLTGGGFLPEDWDSRRLDTFS